MQRGSGPRVSTREEPWVQVWEALFDTPMLFPKARFLTLGPAAGSGLDAGNVLRLPDALSPP